MPISCKISILQWKTAGKYTSKAQYSTQMMSFPKHFNRNIQFNIQYCWITQKQQWQKLKLSLTSRESVNLALTLCVWGRARVNNLHFSSMLLQPFPNRAPKCFLFFRARTEHSAPCFSNVSCKNFPLTFCFLFLALSLLTLCGLPLVMLQYHSFYLSFSGTQWLKQEMARSNPELIPS